MKATIIMFFAAAATLVAAETHTVAPTTVTNVEPVLQVELVEQARLVAEIAKEASHGFDSESHARSLRTQIEALLYKPAPTKPAVKADSAESITLATEPATKVPAITPLAAQATGITTSVFGPDPTALKEAIRILRAEADRLEVLLQKLSRQP